MLQCQILASMIMVDAQKTIFAYQMELVADHVFVQAEHVKKAHL